MTFVLITGGIDLSVGSNMYLSGAVAGLLMQDVGAPMWLAILACLAVGLLFGAVNAFLVTRLSVIPFVATLGTMVAGRGLGWFLTESKEVTFPEGVVSMGAWDVLGILPLPILIFGVVVLRAHLYLTRTPRGRQIYAVGNDPGAAEKAGIPTARVLSTAYLVCGLLAALGGFVMVAKLGNINSGFGEGVEFKAIAAAVLGGTSLFGGIGTVFPGAVLGAILIPMVSAGLVFANTNLYLRPLIEAGIIFLAVFLDSLRIRQLANLGRRPIRIENIRKGVVSDENG
jgi:ribose/xylose/arabinose/galactoside ABC-type transport system permease subunit